MDTVASFYKERRTFEVGVGGFSLLTSDSIQLWLSVLVEVGVLQI